MLNNQRVISIATVPLPFRAAKRLAVESQLPHLLHDICLGHGVFGRGIPDHPVEEDW